MSNLIPVGVSNRHIHLSSQHLNDLFGEGFELTELKPLSQPGQFAANETVTIKGPKGEIHNVRILGPVRGDTQVELSKTDTYIIGVHAPVRMSGNIEGTPGLTIIGPKGEVTIDQGVIIAKRHIHFAPEDAQKFGVVDKQKVKIKSLGERCLIFDEVIARVHPTYALDCHIDTDEANAAGIASGEQVELILD